MKKTLIILLLVVAFTGCGTKTILIDTTNKKSQKADISINYQILPLKFTFKPQDLFSTYGMTGFCADFFAILYKTSQEYLIVLQRVLTKDSQKTRRKTDVSEMLNRVLR